jgi:protein-disulfide isomerase
LAQKRLFFGKKPVKKKSFGGDNKMTESAQSEASGGNSYILPLSIILASLIVSGAILFGISQLPTAPATGLATGNTNPQPTAPTNPQPSGAAAQPAQPTAPIVTNADFASLPDSQWEGSSNASVTMVVFSDFQCPFCERFYTNSYKQLKTDYVDTGKVRVAFANFPLSFHPNAQPAANAAACAGEQGKFFEFHDKLFENQASLSDSFYKQTAQQLGLNATQFNSCYDSKKYDSAVNAEESLGQRLGVSGTPSVFVGGKLIVGACPENVFSQAIEAELAGKTWSVSSCQFQGS